MQLFVLRKMILSISLEMGLRIHRAKSLSALIIILGCPKLIWYLLTLKDDLHQLHAYLSILKPSPRQNAGRYLGHDVVNGQILEKMLKPVAFVELFKGTLQSLYKYSTFDLKAKDSLPLARKAANPFFLLPRTNLRLELFSRYILHVLM